MKARYDSFAALLDYPTSDLAHVATTTAGDFPSEEMTRFVTYATAVSPHSAEELYIATFDISARSCLEAGWHLFGESYQRGVLLVKLRVAAREHGVAEGSELPDHLTILLRLLGRLESADARTSLVIEVILPAIEPMRAALKGNPYGDLLGALESQLRTDFAIETPRRTPMTHLPVYTEMDP